MLFLPRPFHQPHPGFSRPCGGRRGFWGSLQMDANLSFLDAGFTVLARALLLILSMSLLVWVRQGGADSMKGEKQVAKQKGYTIHIPLVPRRAFVC